MPYNWFDTYLIHVILFHWMVRTLKYVYTLKDQVYEWKEPLL